MNDLARLDPIGLAELTEQAELLTRHDRKYVVHDDQLFELLMFLPGDHRVLDVDGRRRFRYDTTYFDTPDLRSYHDAARGRPIRWKIRNRTYCDEGTAWTEVKLRDRRGRTVKHRHARAATDPWTHLTGDRDFAATFVDGRHLTLSAVEQLTPVLTTSYTRLTLLDPSTAGRITIDFDLCCAEHRGAEVDLAGAVVVETKSPGRPLAVDRLLWRLGCRPVRLSKYATAMAALHPDLPSNRWRRTLGTTPLVVHRPTTHRTQEVLR